MAVLGAVVIDPDELSSIAFLRPYHFDLGAHATIFEAMLKCRQRGAIDLVLLASEVGDLPAVGGTNYLAELVESCPSSKAAPHYARIVYEHAARRKVVAISDQLRHEVGDLESIGRAIKALEAVKAALERA